MFFLVGSIWNQLNSFENYYGINKIRTKVAVNYPKMRISPDESEASEIEEKAKNMKEKTNARPIVDEATVAAMSSINMDRKAKRDKVFNFK